MVKTLLNISFQNSLSIKLVPLGKQSLSHSLLKWYLYLEETD